MEPVLIPMEDREFLIHPKNIRILRPRTFLKTFKTFKIFVEKKENQR